MRFACIWTLIAAIAMCTGTIPAFAQEETLPCGAFDDAFDRLDPARWAEVLLLSPSPGTVRSDGGRLLLEADDDKPHEIQVYSMFTLSGDFDVQVEYRVPAEDTTLAPCRFNGGIVVQTQDDRLSYKAYISSKPDRRLLFRTRLDRFGEANLEKFQTRPAPESGILRLTRRAGRVTFRAWVDGVWQVIYPFRERCTEKMRVRFKLQTGGEEGMGQACPVTLALDNFRVNRCGAATRE